MFELKTLVSDPKVCNFESRPLRRTPNPARAFDTPSEPSRQRRSAFLQLTPSFLSLGNVSEDPVGSTVPFYRHRKLLPVAAGSIRHQTVSRKAPNRLANVVFLFWSLP